MTTPNLKTARGPAGAHSGVASANTPQEQTVLQTQIAATNRQIDRLMNDLYGLTEEEIGIVEEGNKL